MSPLPEPIVVVDVVRPARHRIGRRRFVAEKKLDLIVQAEAREATPRQGERHASVETARGGRHRSDGHEHAM